MLKFKNGLELLRVISEYRVYNLDTEYNNIRFDKNELLGKDNCDISYILNITQQLSKEVDVRNTIKYSYGLSLMDMKNITESFYNGYSIIKLQMEYNVPLTLLSDIVFFKDTFPKDMKITSLTDCELKALKIYRKYPLCDKIHYDYIDYMFERLHPEVKDMDRFIYAHLCNNTSYGRSLLEYARRNNI